MMHRFFFKLPTTDDLAPGNAAGPFWVVRTREGFYVMMAFAPDLQALTVRFTEAYDVQDDGPTPLTYSTRFPKPDWYEG